MNANTRFLNEAKEFAERWEALDWNAFEKFSSLRSTTAILLEGQRLTNEMPTGNIWLTQARNGWGLEVVTREGEKIVI